MGVAALVASSSLVKADSQEKNENKEGGSPRQVGRRHHGHYWGSEGEHIDLKSGNLCLTVPLVKVVSRKLATVLRLSYNSQIAKSNGSDLQEFGVDVGYGFAWKCQFAAITKVKDAEGSVTGYTLGDDLGSEFALTAEGDKWVSLSGDYQTFNPETATLYRTDGTTYLFGCTSGPGEPDAGTLYPTCIRDTNGNTITINYQKGRGEKLINSSARIAQIVDATSVFASGDEPTFTFEYSDEAQPHLTAIISNATPTLGWKFAFSTGSRQSPFPAAGKKEQSVHFLSSADQVSGGKKEFQYNDFAELARFTINGDATLSWSYRTFTFAPDTSIREVQTRQLSLASGQGYQQQNMFVRDESDSSLSGHSTLTLLNGHDAGKKIWRFVSDEASSDNGLLSATETYSGSKLKKLVRMTWNRTPSGAPYISSKTETTDPGTNTSVIRNVRSVQDQFGNLVERRHFGSGDLGGPARIHSYFYLASEDYLALHILNRIVKSTIQRGDENVTLVQAMYDTTPVSDAEAITQHQSDTFGTGYTLRGNLTERIYKGVYSKVHYDITGLRTEVEDSAGTTHTYQYAPNTNNTLIASVVPNGAQHLSASMEYSGGRLKAIKYPNGATRTMEYDAQGQFQILSSSGLLTTIVKDPQASTVTISRGDTWSKITKDGLGRIVVRESGGSGQSSLQEEFAYAPTAHSTTGRLFKTSLPHNPAEEPVWLVRLFDDMGRIISQQTGHAEAPSTFEYKGHTKTVRDGAGRWKQVVHNSGGQVAKVILPNPEGGEQETSYEYDVLGNLTHITMPRSRGTQRRSFKHDANGRMVNQQHAESGARALTYNSDGTLSSKKDAKGQKEVFTRDLFKRVTKKTYFDKNGRIQEDETLSYFFDENPFDSGFSLNANGHLAAVQWGSSQSGPGLFTEMYSYTPSGMVAGKKVTIQRGRSTASLEMINKYDDEGRLESMQYPQGGPLLTHSYDESGRLASLHAAEYPVVKNAGYTEAGQLSRLDVLTSTDGSFLTETRQYDERSRLIMIKAAASDPKSSAKDNPLVHLEYGYDQRDGRVKTAGDRVANRAVTYRYDSHGRLEAATSSDLSWGLAFAYDGFGNRTKQRITSGTAYAHEAVHDPATNWMLSPDITYDANGNLLSLPYMRFEYDARNRIVAVNYMAGQETYGYDAKDRRIWKMMPNGSESIMFYGSAGQRLATYTIVHAKDGSLGLELKDTYTYFGRRMVRSQGEAVVLDRLGATRGRSSGSAKTTASYLPFGEELAASAKQEDSFGAYHRDNSGLDYAGHRFYSSEIGRFLSPDPYEGSAHVGAPDSWNRYSYAGNDPINRSDPSGLASLNCSSEDQNTAAAAASDYGSTASTGNEAGQYMYQGANGNYGDGPTSQGTPDGVQIGISYGPGDRVSGSMHSHPTGSVPDAFSDADVDFAYDSNVPEYMVDGSTGDINELTINADDTISTEVVGNVFDPCSC